MLRNMKRRYQRLDLVVRRPAFGTMHEPAVKQKLCRAPGIGTEVLAPDHSVYFWKELSRRQALNFIAEIVGPLMDEQSIQDVRGSRVEPTVHRLRRHRHVHHGCAMSEALAAARRGDRWLSDIIRLGSATAIL